MRLSIAIIIFCLLLALPGCRRKSAKPGNTGNSSVSDKNLAGAVDPTQARIYLEQGKELYKKDADEQAAEAFLKATKLDPDLAEAYFRLGLAYEALAKSGSSFVAFRKASAACSSA